MRTTTRSAVLFLAAAGTATTLALSSAAGASAANQALMVNGVAGGTALPDLVMANVLGGMFGSYQRHNIPWPEQVRPITGLSSLTLGQSIDQGLTNLDAAIGSSLLQLGAGEHVTVVGLSAGALVVDEELRRLAVDPNAPDKSLLTFVVAGDSSRMLFNKNRYDAILGYRYTPPVDTKYDTTVVTAEYDGFADFPDRPSNVVAVANSLAGMIVQHVPHMLTGLSTVPASNITVTTNPLGGVTTSYLVPATRLPLVQLIPALARQEARLKKIVDAAYLRNDGKNATAATQVPTPATAATGPAASGTTTAGRTHRTAPAAALRAAATAGSQKRPTA